MTKTKTKNYNLIPYQIDDTKTLEVTQIKDDVWLTQKDMAELFQSSKTNISEHLKHIFEVGELDKNTTVRNFLTVRDEGGKPVSRNLTYYNLDAIISVGYRVNSKRGVMFRQWATKIIKDRIKQEYAHNKIVDNKQLSRKKMRAKEINKLLQKRDITQTQIGEILGLSKQSVCKAINGKSFSLLVDTWLTQNLGISLEDKSNIIDNIKLEFNFTDKEINLLEHFLNGGKYLQEAVFNTIKKDIR